jgi:hypothetical protein
MIPFGQLQLMSPNNGVEDPMSKGDIALAGKGVNRWCQLSDAQKRTFITLRALAASPLMMGGDLPSLDAYSLALITNGQMLACNQNGVMGELLYERGGVEVWRALKKGQTNTGWVGVFNRSEKIQGLTVTLEMLGLNSGPSVQARDVWNERSFLLSEAQSQLIQLEAHDVLFLSFHPSPIAKRPNIVYILADDLGYVNDLARHYNTEDRILMTMKKIESLGVNAIVLKDHNFKQLKNLNRYWTDWGGQMIWIADSITLDFDKFEQRLVAHLELGAGAAYIWGGSSDIWFHEGKPDYITKALEIIKSYNIPAGIGAHRNEPIAFKVMAAGAIPPKQGFDYAFQNRADFLCVSMFDFQVDDDIKLFKQSYHEAQNRTRPWRG